jgi:hypothetical protein
MYAVRMRLPDSAHIMQPWRIHAIAPDFGLEDVWELPTPGTPEDFPRLLELMQASEPDKGIVGLLFAIRWKVGALLGWDKPATGLGARVPTLRDRLPEDLRGTAPEEPKPRLPFTPLYLTGNEFAAEIANETMHGILHLGWVGERAQMAVLVKPNGRLGRAYMAAIRPFRLALVYPAMLRRLEREWPARHAYA